MADVLSVPEVSCDPKIMRALSKAGCRSDITMLMSQPSLRLGASRCSVSWHGYNETAFAYLCVR